MAGLYPIGGAYLSLQTPIDNGGVVGIVINSMDFINGQLNTNKLQNVTLWLTYVKEILLNTSRIKPTLQNQTYQLNNWTYVSNTNQGSSIMMILWLITFVYLIWHLIISTVVQYIMDNKDKQETTKLTMVRTRRKPNFLNRRKSRRMILVYTMLSIVILWTIFMILLCISQYLIVTKFSTTTNNTNSSTTNSTTSYASISDTISSSFTYLNNFINVVTNQTSLLLASSLSSIATTTRAQMNTSISEFGSQVLVTFNITSLFKTAQILINGINDVVNSMTYINDNCQNTLKDIDNTKGSVNVYQSNINNFITNICNSLTDPNLQYKCQVLQAKNSFFKVNIETGSVSSSSSIIMLFVLKQYNINITNIATSFNQINSDFQTKLLALYNTTVYQLDVASYLTFASSTWNSFISGITPTLSSMSTYKTTITTYLDYVSKYEYIIIIVLIILLFIVLLLLLFFSFRESVQERSLHLCLNFFIQFLFIIIPLLASMICIAILITVNFTQSEICNQVNTTAGVNLLDQMINLKLASPWTTIMKSLNSSITITLSQPTDLLSGIKDRCRNTNSGLLAILNMGNIVNISQIVRSPAIMAVVAKAQNDSLNSFLAVNPQQIIPSNLTAFFAQTKTLIVYFDSIDYSAGIQELQKPLVGFGDFPDFFHGLSNFISQASASIGWTNDLRYLNDTVTRLLQMIPNLKIIQQNVNTLSTNFQVLQNNRNNTYLLNLLTSTINNVQSLFSNPTLLISLFSSIYNDMIAVSLMNSVELIIGQGINRLTNQMIPCNDLANLFEAVSTTVCSNSNLIYSMATLGIILVVVIVICEIISLVVIVSISLRLNVEKNVSNC